MEQRDIAALAKAYGGPKADIAAHAKAYGGPKADIAARQYALLSSHGKKTE
jgi:hypothetical protein